MGLAWLSILGVGIRACEALTPSVVNAQDKKPLVFSDREGSVAWETCTSLTIMNRNSMFELVKVIMRFTTSPQGKHSCGLLKSCDLDTNSFLLYFFNMIIFIHLWLIFIAYLVNHWVNVQHCSCIIYYVIYRYHATKSTRANQTGKSYSVCQCIHPFIALLCSPHSADLNLIHQQVPTGF